MATYSRTITKQVTDSNQLQYVEDIKYGTGANAPRVGGVSITIAGRARDAAKAWNMANATQTANADTLDQQFDVTYNGKVVGHISIVCVPDPTLPNGHSTSVDTSWSDPAAGAAIEVLTLA